MALSMYAVRWVAHLGRLELSPAELETATRHLSNILDYIEQLKQVDTTNVEPLAHPLPVQNVFRDDEPRPSLPAEEALANAPRRKGDFFSVPAVLD